MHTSLSVPRYLPFFMVCRGSPCTYSKDGHGWKGIWLSGRISFLRINEISVHGEVIMMSII